MGMPTECECYEEFLKDESSLDEAIALGCPYYDDEDK